MFSTVDADLGGVTVDGLSATRRRSDSNVTVSIDELASVGSPRTAAVPGRPLPAAVHGRRTAAVPGRVRSASSADCWRAFLALRTRW